MDKLEYQEYLKSEHWQELRSRILERDGHRCQLCGSTENLHVHHKTYETLWHEADGDLITLCSDCHETFHICLDNAKAKIRSCNEDHSKMFCELIQNDDRFADLNEHWAMAMGSIYTEALIPFADKIPPVDKTKLVSLFNAQNHSHFWKLVTNERIRQALFRKEKMQYPFTVAMQSFSKIIRQKRRF